MKEKILYVVLTMFASLASANTCGVVIDFPPGGTSDRYARLLQKYNSDYRVEYKTGGMSVPAMNYIGDNPEMIYLGSPVLFGDKSPVKNPPIELYKILIGAPILAVTTKVVSVSSATILILSVVCNQAQFFQPTALVWRGCGPCHVQRVAV